MARSSGDDRWIWYEHTPAIVNKNQFKGRLNSPWVTFFGWAALIDIELSIFKQ